MNDQGQSSSGGSSRFNRGGSGRFSGGGSSGGGMGGGRKPFMRQRRKVCFFCANPMIQPDYKDVDLMARFIADRGKILATELQINFPLENYLITGFIDRLDQKSEGHYEIHDYKTSSRLPTRAACMSERQLALYHVGILDAYPDALQVDLVWHYLRFDQEIRLSKSLKELEEVKTKTLELIHTIEKDQCFSPNESALCAWCEYTPLCPSRKYHRSGGVPYRKSKAIDKSSALLQRYTRLHQSIQSQENQLFLLRDQMKKLKQEIEAYSQSNECQEFHNSEASLLLKKRKRISFPDLNENDTNILQEWLDKKQLWKELSSLDLQKIRQYMQNGQRDPEIKKKLLEYAEISEIFEFCYDDKNLKKSKKPDSN
jgi:hypothetical protein